MKNPNIRNFAIFKVKPLTIRKPTTAKITIPCEYSNMYVFRYVCILARTCL